MLARLPLTAAGRKCCWRRIVLEALCSRAQRGATSCSHSLANRGRTVLVFLLGECLQNVARGGLYMPSEQSRVQYDAVSARQVTFAVSVLLFASLLLSSSS